MTNYIPIAEKLIDSPNFIAAIIILAVVLVIYFYFKFSKKENKEHDYTNCPNTCIIKDLVIKYEHLEKIKLDKDTFDEWIKKIDNLIISNAKLETSMCYVAKSIDEIKELMTKKVR
jgi:hypothetical protein